MSGVPAVIQPVSALLAALTTPLHPVLFPVPLLPLLHAFRISVAYRHLNSLAGGNTSVAADLAGFLLMAWGGSIVSHILLSLPIPQLLTFTPILVYTGTHLLCVAGMGRLPRVATLDSVFPLVDGLLRTSAIAAGVDACRTHPTAAVSQSLSIQLFVGAVASSGGGIAAQTLSVWEPTWRLTRPLFLQHGSILAATDVWSGSLVAALYGYLTASHPLYLTLYPNSAPTKSSPLLSSLDAKAAASLVLTSIYCWRVYNVHYSSRKNLKNSRDTSSTKSKSKNE